MTEKKTDAFALAAGLMPVGALLGPFAAVPGARFVNITTVSLLAAVLLYFAVRAREQRLGRFFGDAWPYALYFAVLMAYALVSLFWVKDPMFSFINTLCIQLGGVGMLLIVAAAVRSREDLLWLLDVLTVCLTLVVLLGIFEIFTGRFLFPNNNSELYLRNIYGRYFPYAVFHNTNNYSAFVTLALPFAIYDLVCRLGARAGAALSVLLGGAAVFTLLNADPRACYIAIAVMAAAAVVTLPGGKKLPSLKKLWPAGLVAFLALSAFAVRKGVKLVAEMNSLNTGDHSVRERLLLTQAAFRMLPDTHWMGVGAGNYIQLLPYYSSSIKNINLHNMTLQILTEYGAVMFAGYLLVLVMLAVQFFRRRRENGRDGVLAVIGFMEICAFPVVGIAAADATRDAITWVFLGILLAALRVTEIPRGRFDRVCPVVRR